MTNSTTTPDQTSSTQTTAVIPVDAPTADTTFGGTIPGAPTTGASVPGAPTAGAAASGAPAGPGAPAFPAQYTAPQPATVLPPQSRTNVLGVVTLVLGILGLGVVPVITGHIALNQIKRTGEEGRGLTLAGLILGYVTVAGWLAVVLFWVAAAGLAVMGAAIGSNY